MPALTTLITPADLAAFLAVLEAHPVGWLLAACAGVALLTAWSAPRPRPGLERGLYKARLVSTRARRAQALRRPGRAGSSGA